MVKIQTDDFNIQEEINLLTQEHKNIGAISVFIGLVRDFNAHLSDKTTSKVQSLYLEHYPKMTKKSLQTICDVATEKWDLQGCSIIHRIGQLRPADNIVLVICAAAQRMAAMSGCELVINALKIHAPFWKKEIYEDGTSAWVTQCADDRQLAEKIVF